MQDKRKCNMSMEIKHFNKDGKLLTFKKFRNGKEILEDDENDSNKLRSS